MDGHCAPSAAGWLDSRRPWFFVEQVIKSRKPVQTADSSQRS